MKPLAITVKERKQLADAEALLKQALADLRILKAGPYSYQRARLVTDATHRVWEILHQVEDDLDIFGTRRQAEAAEREARKPKLLPFFDTTRSPIDEVTQ